MLTDDPRHGTHAGYVAHRARNETACTACRDAHAVYARALRDRPEGGGDLGPTMNLIPSPLTVKLADMAIEHARAADNGADAALAWLPHIHPTQVPAFVGIVLGKAANTKRATVDDRLRHLAAEQRRAAREARLAQEDLAYTDADARKAHAAYVAGVRNDWAATGDRVYHRRRRRLQREAS